MPIFETPYGTVDAPDLGAAQKWIATNKGGGPAAGASTQFDTKLSPSEETGFSAWKNQYAPRDSGADYDLRGAFKAGLTPDPASGHWPDTFKKPNHPTFSNQSKYATGEYAAKAGRWEGENFIPPASPAAAGAPKQEEGIAGRLWEGLKAGWSDKQFKDAGDVPGGAVGIIGALPSRMAYRTAQGVGEALKSPGRAVEEGMPTNPRAAVQRTLPLAGLMAGSGWRAPKSVAEGVAAKPAEAAPATAAGEMTPASMWSSLQAGGAISPERMARATGQEAHAGGALMPHAPGGLQDARGPRPIPAQEMPLDPGRLARAQWQAPLLRQPPAGPQLRAGEIPREPSWMAQPARPSRMEMQREIQPAAGGVPTRGPSGEVLRTAAGVQRPITAAPPQPAARMTMNVPEPAAPKAAEPISPLVDALVTNNAGAVDRQLVRSYRRAVQPGKPEGLPAGRRGRSMQDQRTTTEVDNIISNRANLKFTDPNGNPVRQQLPTSLSQFEEALDQNMSKAFQAYDQMNAAAGSAGVKVDLTPVAAKLREIAVAPQIRDWNPSIAADAIRYAETVEAQHYYTPMEAQAVVENLNQTLKSYYRNPPHDIVSRQSLLRPVSDVLREQMDKAIEQVAGPGYQAFRNRYGAIRSVQQEVRKAIDREANKAHPGLADMWSDPVNYLAGEEVLRGAITGHPEAVATGAAIKAAQLWVRRMNEPNRAIEQMFRRRLTAGQPPGRPYASPLGAVGAGIASDRGPNGGRIIQQRSIPAPQ